MNGCNYVRAAELKASTPTLFDLMEAEDDAPTEDSETQPEVSA
jgi:hypothetical protein